MQKRSLVPIIQNNRFGPIAACLHWGAPGEEADMAALLADSFLDYLYGSSGAYQNGSLRTDPAYERRLRPFHRRLDDLSLGEDSGAPVAQRRNEFGRIDR